ncbi:uncharacterized protein LOC144926976 isoform X2 [Branchiostoma floridae x Branchiostoma belcheri]
MFTKNNYSFLIAVQNLLERLVVTGTGGTQGAPMSGGFPNSRWRPSVDRMELLVWVIFVLGRLLLHLEGRTRLWPGKQQEETLADLGFSRSVDKSLLVLPPAAVRSPGPHLEDRETEVTRLAKEIGLAC